MLNLIPVGLISRLGGYEFAQMRMIILKAIGRFFPVCVSHLEILDSALDGRVWSVLLSLQWTTAPHLPMLEFCARILRECGKFFADFNRFNTQFALGQEHCITNSIPKFPPCSRVFTHLRWEMSGISWSSRQHFQVVIFRRSELFEALQAAYWCYFQKRWLAIRLLLL